MKRMGKWPRKPYVKPKVTSVDLGERCAACSASQQIVDQMSGQIAILLTEQELSNASEARAADWERVARGHAARIDRALEAATFLWDADRIDASHEGDDCPEDDTCECFAVAKINALFAALTRETE